jgi:ParB/RepB/Spo0J family partition protein
MSRYQQFRDLTADEEADLKDSMKQHGFIVPIVYDEDGEIIDGHQRHRIAIKLGINPTEIGLDVTGNEARAIARDLNLARRHLDRDERAAYVEQLRAEGDSIRTIAKKIGASVGTVHADLKSSVQNRTPDHEAAKITLRTRTSMRDVNKTIDAAIRVMANLDDELRLRERYLPRATRDRLLQRLTHLSDKVWHLQDELDPDPGDESEPA